VKNNRLIMTYSFEKLVFAKLKYIPTWGTFNKPKLWTSENSASLRRERQNGWLSVAPEKGTSFFRPSKRLETLLLGDEDIPNLLFPRSDNSVVVTTGTAAIDTKRVPCPDAVSIVFINSFYYAVIFREVPYQITASKIRRVYASSDLYARALFMSLFCANQPAVKKQKKEFMQKSLNIKYIHNRITSKSLFQLTHVVGR